MCVCDLTSGSLFNDHPLHVSSSARVARPVYDTGATNSADMRVALQMIVSSSTTLDTATKQPRDERIAMEYDAKSGREGSMVCL